MTELDRFLKHMRGNDAVPVKLGRTLYFDESNNVRKAIINYPNDNNPNLENTCFVLGGIAPNRPVDFEDLLQYIGARQKPHDAKYSFFVCGRIKFKESLQQPRLRKLFEYLDKEGVLIHFSTHHYYHYALVDILDSMLPTETIKSDWEKWFYRSLQSAMTEVLYCRYDDLHGLLYRYAYPKVQKEKLRDFLNDIYALYCENLDFFDMGEFESFFKEYVRQILETNKDDPNYSFWEGREPYVISDKVDELYWLRMSNFVDLTVFDIEKNVEERLSKVDSNYMKKLNCKFVDSKDVPEIQISDAIAGFVGRLYDLLFKMDKKEIRNFVKQLDSESFKTLFWFFDLVYKSNQVSKICFHCDNPVYIENRFNFMYGLVMDMAETEARFANK